MRKHRITQVKFAFSEHSGLSVRIFYSLLAADMAILTEFADMDATRLDGYKTDYEVRWEDGEVWTGTFCANRKHLLSVHLFDLYRYHTTADRPEYVTPTDWRNKLDYMRSFSETHAIA